MPEPFIDRGKVKCPVFREDDAVKNATRAASLAVF
jgi:hypothetical protein